jgi:type VI secretion system protein ImpH
MITSQTLPDTHFFQLLRHTELSSLREEGRASSPLAADMPLHTEFVDFSVVQNLAFAASACTKMEPLESHGLKRHKLHVACFGLTGPSGVLPLHYTELLSDRSRDKDSALRSLLDGFNARTIGFLYKAWQKNRLVIEHENHVARDEKKPSQATTLLKGYTGLQVANEKSIKSDTESLALYFSGYYSKRPRNAYGLRKIISRALECEVELKPFYGRWFDLDPSQRNAVGQRNATLGMDFVIGSSVYEGSCSFRICTAPLSLSEFQALQPGQPKFETIKELLHLYIGHDYCVDLQVALKGQDKPAFRLPEGQSNPAMRLGEGLWLSATGASGDVTDAVYEVNR